MVWLRELDILVRRRWQFELGRKRQTVNDCNYCIKAINCNKASHLNNDCYFLDWCILKGEADQCGLFLWPSSLSRWLRSGSYPDTQSGDSGFDAACIR